MGKCLATLLFYFSVAQVSADDTVLLIEDAFIREAPPGIAVTAAYAVLLNPGNEMLVVRQISSDDFAKIEIHLSKLEGGVAMMVPQSELRIPANGQIILQPGSYHLMLFGAGESVQKERAAEFTLHTSQGDISAKFTLKKY